MIIAVYKTAKKAGMFLYVSKKGDFSSVPKALLAQFGHPELVMLLPVDKRDTIAGVEKASFLNDLNAQGFYLQLPPKEEDLLAEHRIKKGLSAQPDSK